MVKLICVLENLTPPALYSLIKRLFSKNHVSYSGNLKIWAEALKHCKGYDSPMIAEKICAAMLKIKSGEAAYERDGVLFEKIQYSWPLLVGLLRVASLNDNELNVLDFGGSLGSTYYQNRRFLTHLRNVNWHIVEQPLFVEYGKKHFAGSNLNFYTEVDDVAKNHTIDVAILSSSLPYIQNPHELINKLLNYNFKHIIIDRTPFLTVPGTDRLTIEKVPSSIYEASYPAWFFDSASFFNLISKKYTVIHEFEALAGEILLKSPYAKAIDKGFILQLK